MAETEPQQPRRSPRALGRRIGAIVYWAVVVGVSLAAGVEITWQVFFAPSPKAPYASCHEGLHALHGAVVRARDEAAHTEAGENAALAGFRAALQPEWTYRDGVASLCRGSAKDEGALDAIERLRYAEEHAVRREAGELAPLRRRVQAIVDGELGGRSGLTPPTSSATVRSPNHDGAENGPKTPVP
ncbi:Hypothetical protein A7982_02502 [Minicystis rosea]|nr:Hypothetical protein A7982_02502 [Minicystis rosea]